MPRLIRRPDRPRGNRNNVLAALNRMTDVLADNLYGAKQSRAQGEAADKSRALVKSAREK